MKRLFIILLILLWAGAAWGRAVNVVVGQAVGVACTTSTDSAIFENTTTTSNVSFGYTTWRAAKVTLDATTTVTALSANMRDVATTDSCTVTLSLYTNNSGAPGSEVSGTAVTIAETSINDAANADYEVALSTPVSVATGTYWLVMRNNHGSETATTRIYYGAGSSGDSSSSTDGGSSWSAQTPQLAVKVMGCE